VTVVSDGLSDHDVEVLGFDRAARVEEALERQGREARIVVLTHGGETLPVLETEYG
jgi:hypothetical protein